MIKALCKQYYEKVSHDEVMKKVFKSKQKERSSATQLTTELNEHLPNAWL